MLALDPLPDRDLHRQQHDRGRRHEGAARARPDGSRRHGARLLRRCRAPRCPLAVPDRHRPARRDIREPWRAASLRADLRQGRRPRRAASCCRPTSSSAAPAAARKTDERQTQSRQGRGVHPDPGTCHESALHCRADRRTLAQERGGAMQTRAAPRATERPPATASSARRELHRHALRRRGGAARRAALDGHAGRGLRVSSASARHGCAPPSRAWSPRAGSRAGAKGAAATTG